MRQRVFAVAVFLFAATIPAFAGYRTASWMPLYNTLALPSTQMNAGRLVESNPAWYQFTSNGTIVRMNGAESSTWRAAMTGTEVIPTVQNLVNGSFDKSVAVNAISSANREAHAQSIYNVVMAQGYDGIDLDYENLPYSSQADFVAFVNVLKNKLHASGKKLSVTVYAKRSGSATWDGEGGHDYIGIGAAADYVKIMLYPFTYSGKPAGPIAPLTWIDEVLTYAKSTMPASKIIVGLPWYGKDWVGTSATSIAYTEMMDRVNAYGATIGRDVNGEATFSYGTHTVFFVDSYAYDRKVDFVLQRHPDVAGFGHWASGEEDPGVWTKVEALKNGTAPTATVPAAPSALGAVAAASTITLSWADGSNNEDGFRLERCTGASCAAFSQIAQLGAGVTGYLDASVAEGTTYTYRVRAFNAAGNSAYSNNGVATTTTTPMPPANVPVGNTLIPTGATWRYLDNGSNQGSSWTATAFNDGSWKSGQAQLGYGDGDERTIVSYGGSSPKFVTTYFRYSVDVTNPGAFSALKLRILRDDGAVVYLNGQEVFRSNMPSGAITNTTLASGDANETTFYESAVNPALLVAGRNVIAVEIHQADPYSSDISFDFELTGTASTSGSLIPAGSTWKYLDNGSDQGTAWRAASFADATWKSGNAQFGYGDGDESTVVEYGSSKNKYVTTYFRRTFEVADPAAFNALLLKVLRDDGAIVYINGVEVFRCSNMPSGTVAYNTFAKYALSGSDEATFQQKTLSPSVLVQGTNTIAVEIHQSDASSSDLSFDLSLSM